MSMAAAVSDYLVCFEQALLCDRCLVWQSGSASDSTAPALLLLLLLQILAELTPQKCKVRTGGLPPLLLAAIYGTSITAGLAVAIVLILPLFKKKAKAI
jgi:hypothetical protein